MTTILLVDDSESDLFLLERILSRLAAPHRVVTARDGVEAQQQLWQLAAATTPQDRVVVFTDLEMPRQNGLEFLDWLKHTPEFRNLYVVMLSGCSDSAFMNKAYQLGALAWLVKPPDKAAVEGLLGTIVRMESRGSACGKPA